MKKPLFSSVRVMERPCVFTILYNISQRASSLGNVVQSGKLCVFTAIEQFVSGESYVPSSLEIDGYIVSGIFVSGTPCPWKSN